jgi:CBS domain-containing protein
MSFSTGALSVQPPGGYLILEARRAADLMMPNPVSLNAEATIREASAFLTSKGFSAAPVIDAAGRPIGVLSQTDIVTQEREWESTGTSTRTTRRVRDLMTPGVFAVTPDTPAYQVVQEMLLRRVHRLFVVDRSGVLIGVISALDVLRHLRPAAWGEVPLPSAGKEEA